MFKVFIFWKMFRLKFLYFGKCLLFWKATEKPNIMTLFFRMLSKYSHRYSGPLVFSIASKYVNIEKFSHSYMLPWFYLGKVYKTMPKWHYISMASPTQTDLILSMKIDNVTSNVSRPEPSEKNKIAMVITSSTYIVNIQIHSSGTN